MFMTILAANFLSVEAFGQFALILTLLTLSIGLSRTVSSDLLMLYRGGDEDSGSMLSSALFRCCAIAIAAQVSVLLFFTSVPDQAPSPWLLVVAAPFLHDFTRFALIAGDRIGGATLLDCGWGLMIGIFALLIHRESLGSTGWLSLWGLACLPGLLIASLLMRNRLHCHRPTASAIFLDARAIRFGSDYAIGTLSIQIPLWLVAASVGPVGVAALRGADTLLGPVRILLSASNSHLLKTLRAAPFTGLPAISVGSVQAAAVLWGTAVMTIPALGGLLLGESWDAARPVFPVIICGFLAIVVTSVQTVRLKVFGADVELLRLRFFALGLGLGFGIPGAIVGGAMGAAIGAAITSLVSAVGWSIAAHKISQTKGGLL
ncbi:hypothetical protein [Nocardioides sp. P5_C9_2]